MSARTQPAAYDATALDTSPRRDDDTATLHTHPRRSDDPTTPHIRLRRGDDTATVQIHARGGEAAGVVHIRPLRPDDGELLDRVVEGMGPQSRYQRFHAPKPRLTTSERRYLTHVDGRDHLALVALAPDGAPLGVARCVRLRDDPTAAELAVEVIDACHGRGLGTALMAQLARRAAGAGIERLVARVLDESGLARSLKRRGWRRLERDGASWVLDVDAWTVARAGATPRVPLVPGLAG